MRRAPSSRGGFTLIELMVSIVISGIVCGAVFDLLLGQSRFGRYQGAREEVQQNARVALDVISAELRGAPAGALVSGGTDAIRLRVPRAWGAVCNAVEADTTRLWVRFAPGTFPPDFQYARRRWGVAVAQTASVAEPVARWSFVPTVGSTTAANPCDTRLGASPGAVEAVFTGAGFLDPASGVMTIPAGSQAFVYEEVGYDVRMAAGASTGAGMYWLRRVIGFEADGTPRWEAMAGPLPAADGLELRYSRADGTAIAAPVTAAELPQVARIALTVRTRSRTRTHGVPQLSEASTLVYLRN
ncbi:hypothetical protein BH23GEM3_BH23GEM3_26090 [soil metagenome]